ncbi:beta-1,3-galactosyl-O-glycosyl-glycoprotein beta-1,6-N-acetylglucosaminyltransferase [Patella vulgata]|uniref:beta-1,3-galactosyl-O-glycosyl-glycoprotein beta-1,6-N-acetylglucosaminyltransferase n=1 Tax=Patella vulgata TaxID=6465 RepID=UPI00217FBEDE|nr:beta-1,3-galactosyl-O-glycosyl-glycoprotein beta-1,6-N-acetylglucosaminyltransferase [Patella vulgata]XP_055955012.1 beta-1,3-galactosyl-O-glycosyl-glycoprotein beta-1,6-N-acetylglucosaminyltransferase [Patella vulgata]
MRRKLQLTVMLLLLFLYIVRYFIPHKRTREAPASITLGRVHSDARDSLSAPVIKSVSSQANDLETNGNENRGKDKLIYNKTVKQNLDLITVQREFESFRIPDINCEGIIKGDAEALAESVQKNASVVPDNYTLMKHTTNCDYFRRLYGYEAIINTDEEINFPLAFNILLYKEVAQVEILLRAIYRPQNYYCLHVDGFSPDHVHRAAKSLADCFHNVFIVSKTENVVYKSFQRLQADLNCMADHLAKPDWKYLINLPSQELPIKTNLQIVRILTAINDRNSIECITNLKHMLSDRFVHKYKNKYYADGVHYIVVMTKDKNPPLPHGMKLIKGSAYGVFTHRFVSYVFNNQVAKDLLEWCRGVLSPDEYYWSTLNHNPHLQVPGSYEGPCKGVLSTYVNWQVTSNHAKCKGKVLRFICIFGPGDLKTIVTREELFANKFLLAYSYTAIQCLSEWLRNQTFSPQRIDEQFYESTF